MAHYELITLTFPEPTPTLPPQTVDALRQAPGLLDLWFGQKIENPNEYVLAIRWESREAATTPHVSIVLGALTYSSIGTVPGSAPLGPALDGPTTEIYTAVGCEEGWLQNRLVDFLDRVKAGPQLQGVHADVVADMEPGLQVAVEEPERGIALLAVGWDTRDHHLAEAVEGKAIATNKHLLEPGRKSAGMYHVSFKKL